MSTETKEAAAAAAPAPATEAPPTAWDKYTRREEALRVAKETFGRRLSARLNLVEVGIPLCVRRETGLNDHLSGASRDAPLRIPCSGGPVRPAYMYEVIQSAAKLKRHYLTKYDAPPGAGILTDMRAIRPGEVEDATHSVEVDQYDWELVLAGPEERTPETFRRTVEHIYAAIRETADALAEAGHHHRRRGETGLPEKITFLSWEEAEARYRTSDGPALEAEATREFGAVCLTGIDHKRGKRAPDYDDWSLNGDILVWHDSLQQALELSSMGIRVDAAALERQLAQVHAERTAAAAAEGLRRKPRAPELTPYQEAVARGDLKLTIGGGIGKSRLMMYLFEESDIAAVRPLCS